MDATVAAWHVVGFFAPSVILGAFAAGLTRLFWRRELAAVSFFRLWLAASAAAGIASIVGLVVFERDGRMLTYAAMVVASAAALWWSGFRNGRG